MSRLLICKHLFVGSHGPTVNGGISLSKRELIQQKDDNDTTPRTGETCFPCVYICVCVRDHFLLLQKQKNTQFHL